MIGEPTLKIETQRDWYNKCPISDGTTRHAHCIHCQFYRDTGESKGKSYYIWHCYYNKEI